MKSKPLILPVKGMTCAACSTRLEKVLNRVSGVQEATVSLASESAAVEFNAGEISVAGVAAVVAKAGFSVPEESVRLAVSGMTCAACSTRLEKVLSRLPGVVLASVNLATEQAVIVIPAGTVPEAELIAAVHRAGFCAVPVLSAAEQREAGEKAARQQDKRELTHVILAAVLTLPLALPMLLMPFGIYAGLPAWLQFGLATPVQFWLGARFLYRGL